MTLPSHSQPKCVFLHGWLGSAYEWDEVARNLTEFDCDCWNLEPDADWGAAIANVASKLPDKCIVVGYSMGARIALACAHLAPKKLAGLVLISANPGLSAEDRSARFALDRETCQQLLNSPIDQFLDQWYRQPIFKSISEETREAWVRTRTSLDRKHQAKILECFSIAHQPDFWPSLAAISVPTLVITGELDTKYRNIAIRLAEHLPDCQLGLIAGASHAPHREQPELVCQLIRRWHPSVTSTISGQTPTQVRGAFP